MPESITRNTQIPKHHRVYLDILGINGSSLFRSAIQREMRQRGHPPEDVKKLVETAEQSDVNLKKLVDKANDIPHFQTLLNEHESIDVPASLRPKLETQ